MGCYFFLFMAIPLPMRISADIRAVIGIPVVFIGIVCVVVAAFTASGFVLVLDSPPIGFAFTIGAVTSIAVIVLVCVLLPAALLVVSVTVYVPGLV